MDHSGRQSTELLAAPDISVERPCLSGLAERALQLPSPLSPPDDVAAATLLNAHYPSILSRIASRSAMLPGRVGAFSRARTRVLRGWGAGGTATRLFAHASNHSSTAVSRTIHRPPISNALSSPFLIARLTVRCSHRASSATAWTVRYGQLSITATGSRADLLWLIQTPKQPITQRADLPRADLPRASDGTDRGGRVSATYRLDGRVLESPDQVLELSSHASGLPHRVSDSVGIKGRPPPIAGDLALDEPAERNADRGG